MATTQHSVSCFRPDISFLYDVNAGNQDVCLWWAKGPFDRCFPLDLGDDYPFYSVLWLSKDHEWIMVI
jgi:hypothetical protein